MQPTENKVSSVDEAANKYAEGKSSSAVFREAHINDFKAGAKWQATQPTHTIGIDELIGVLKLWNYEYVGYEKDDKDEQTFKECAEQYLKQLSK